MELSKHYNNLYQDSLQKIKSDEYQLDELIDSKLDNRFGITLLIRPDLKIKAAFREFSDKLMLIEPEQYFYPDSDVHVTVMSIISCYSGFRLSQINVEDYIALIKESIEEYSGFDITFKGITLSPSCVMTQGFFANNILNEIRNKLRRKFKESVLQQSIDKRYSIQTAHSTIIRLRKILKNKVDFIKLIEKYREINFGSFKVDSLELVYNDWYQRNQNGKELYTFSLSSNN